MRISRWKSGFAVTTATFGIALFLSASPTPPRSQAPVLVTTQEVLLSLDPAQSKVHYTVDSTLHTVHGTFNLKGGSVQFDRANGKAGGEIIVYATSGDSGNSPRDEKMHKEVLQSDKFPEALFRPVQIDGKVSPTGPSDFKVNGTLLLHGSSHEITVPFHADLNAGTWKGTGKFQVPYIQWGLKNPSNFLLKVQPVVNVELELAGTLKSGN